MKFSAKCIRNKCIILVIIIINLLTFFCLQPLAGHRLDDGRADMVPQWQNTTGKSRRRCRVRRIIIWRFVITIIARNRNERVLIPHISIEKLMQNRAVQRFVKNQARCERQQLRARMRQFETYLHTHAEEFQQLIKKYDNKIEAIKAKLPLTTKLQVAWKQIKLALIFQCQQLRERRRELGLPLAILCLAIIILALSVILNHHDYLIWSGALSAGSLTISSSVIKNNHQQYKEVTTKLARSGFQPVLDYGWLVESNPSVLYPTVLDNFDWSLFNNLASKYQRQYSHFLAQERKKATANKKLTACPTGVQTDLLSLLSPLESGCSFHAEDYPLELSADERDELERLHGKKNGGRRLEHDFMPLLKSFIILRFMDIKPSVANVIRTLCGNPYLLVKLQFSDNQLPSSRVIYRFDQVMSRYGLWNEAFELAGINNIQLKVIDPQKETVAGSDTTHVEACATRGKKKKNCAHCPFLADCGQPQPTDNTAGTVVKKKTEYHHAHKVALFNLLHSELCLAFKVFKGNTNDAMTFSPLLEMFHQKFPEFKFTHILVDGIYDDEACYKAAKEHYPQAKLLPSRMNPRGRKDKAVANRGILLVNKRGQAVCINRQKMVFVSRELKQQTYIWGCPFSHPDVTSAKKFTAPEKYRILEEYRYNRDLEGTAKRHGITAKILMTWDSRRKCARDKKLDPKGWRGLEDECPLKDQCCPRAKYGRIFRTKADEYPFLNWKLPYYSYQRRVIVALRLANERIISRLKENLAGDKLYKQNDFNIEAHIARSLLAQHIFATVAFTLERPDAIRRIKTFHSMFPEAA
jgi:hypothetical protein